MFWQENTTATTTRYKQTPSTNQAIPILLELLELCRLTIANLSASPELLLTLSSALNSNQQQYQCIEVKSDHFCYGSKRLVVNSPDTRANRSVLGSR